MRCGQVSTALRRAEGWIVWGILRISWTGVASPRYSQT